MLPAVDAAARDEIVALSRQLAERLASVPTDQRAELLAEINRTLAAVFTGGLMTLGFAQSSEAALFIRLAANAAQVSCDNGTAAGVQACSANGFTTTLESDSLTFNGTVGGYSFGSLNLASNGPGTSTMAYVLDSKFNVTHSGVGTGDLTVAFGGYNFTLPAGPGLILSASQTANWTTGQANDSSALQVWGRADNLTIVPGGTATAISPTLVSPAGLTNSLASQSPDVPFTRLVTPFALTGFEQIHQAIGDVASYTGTATALATPVPEPASLFLLGTGLLALARIRRRSKQ